MCAPEGTQPREGMEQIPIQAGWLPRHFLFCSRLPEGQAQTPQADLRLWLLVDTSAAACPQTALGASALVILLDHDTARRSGRRS